MSKEYEQRIVGVTVVTKGDDLISEQATTIKIRDQGSGEYVEVWQNGQSLSIDKEEWDAVREAIDKMITLCRNR